jgi:hypothetical protein
MTSDHPGHMAGSSTTLPERFVHALLWQTVRPRQADRPHKKKSSLGRDGVFLGLCTTDRLGFLAGR